MVKRKYLIAGAIVAAGLLIASYLGSPFLAVHALKDAARKGDADKLSELVDFPAVRESMKAQLQAAMTANLQADPEMQSNPFAGFAMMMIPTIINNAVDIYVTADGISAMVQGQKPSVPTTEPNSPATPPAPTPTPKADPAPVKDIETSYAYKDLDTFQVQFAAKGDKPFTMIMKRQGLFDWRLKRIQFPEGLFDESTEAAAPPT